MAIRIMEAPQQLPNPLTSFWNLLEFNARENHQLLMKKRSGISQVSGLSLAVLSPIFAVLNAINGIYGLVAINVVTCLLGLAALFCARKGSPTIAAVILTVPLPPLLFLSGVLFENGMEHILLLTFMGAIFMLDRPYVRLPVAALIGIQFTAAKVLLFNPTSSALPVGRHTINLIVFQICFYWVLEVFRVANIRYQRTMEEKNRHLKNLTTELEHANLAKEKIFRIVSHDLRGPLGNLQSTIDLVSAGDLSYPEFQTLLPGLRSEVEGASHHLDTLLQWSSGQLSRIQPALRPVALASVWDEVREQTEERFRRKGVRLKAAIPGNVTVWSDQDLLSIILGNLVSNALKFTPEHGEVTFAADLEDNGCWRLSVSDTGVGISEERLRALLSRVPSGSTRGTANERGLGLGLRICQDLLHALGSGLAVSSTEGAGSRFYFPLPKGEALPAERLQSAMSIS